MFSAEQGWQNGPLATADLVCKYCDLTSLTLSKGLCAPEHRPSDAASLLLWQHGMPQLDGTTGKDVIHKLQHVGQVVGRVTRSNWQEDIVAIRIVVMTNGLGQ
jgi:hypothetical protein